MHSTFSCKGKKMKEIGIFVHENPKNLWKVFPEFAYKNYLGKNISQMFPGRFHYHFCVKNISYLEIDTDLCSSDIGKLMRNIQVIMHHQKEHNQVYQNFQFHIIDGKLWIFPILD